MSDLTVIVASPDVDGVASAAIVARGIEGSFETFFMGSEELPGFFEPSIQLKLPRMYTLVICGLNVVYMSWDGELVRPDLMDVLRSFSAPVRWFSTGGWRSEDVAAVRNIIGEQNLVLQPEVDSTAELVHEAFAAPGDDFADALKNFAADTLSEEDDERWGNDWRRVINSLKKDAFRLNTIVGPLIENRPEELDPELQEEARQTQRKNRDLAGDRASELIYMRDHTLVTVEIPREHHAFWEEVSEYARAERGAEFCLAILAERPVMVLTRGQEPRVDLRKWVRYLTDMMTPARALEGRPDAVPIYVKDLTADQAIKRKVVDLLAQGAHLLAD